MRNLYELTGSYLELQNMVEMGFDPESIADTLEALEGEIEDKAENYGLVIQNLNAQAESLDTEATRLLERKSLIDKNVNAMKNSLSTAMLALGKEKFKTDHFTFSHRKSESVNIIDTTLIPSDYIKIKTTESVDKVSIKKALKEGLLITGAELSENKNFNMK